MLVNPFDKPTAMDKQLAASVVFDGDTVIDATCGNGHDTKFLAECVGPSGKVYAFDVQESAIEITRNRLEEDDLSDRVCLVNSGHEHISNHIAEEREDGKISCVMYNLGYLPGSDKEIVTTPDTTIMGIKSAADLLKPGGLITCVIYPGHKTGGREADVLEEYCAGLDQATFNIRKISSINYVNNPPYMIAISKKEGK